MPQPGAQGARPPASQPGAPPAGGRLREEATKWLLRSCRRRCWRPAVDSGWACGRSSSSAEADHRREAADVIHWISELWNRIVHRLYSQVAKQQPELAGKITGSWTARISTSGARLCCRLLKTCGGKKQGMMLEPGTQTHPGFPEIS